MLDHVKLPCAHCSKSTYHSVPFIEGQIKVMKIHKRDEVALQLKEKRGPFYDKWLAAMEKRGEQMRCSDCLRLDAHPLSRPPNYCHIKRKVMSPGCYACSSLLIFGG